METAKQPALEPQTAPGVTAFAGAPGLAERARLGVVAIGVALLGLAPHVLHHVGPLAGAALFAGAGGSLLFGVLGFLAAIPFLLRLQRRRQSWRVPAAALALMAIVFSLSTFVIGPRITGANQSDTSSGVQAGPTGSRSPLMKFTTRGVPSDANPKEVQDERPCTSDRTPGRF